MPPVDSDEDACDERSSVTAPMCRRAHRTVTTVGRADVVAGESS
ncbi:hypothetical protein [Salinigranum salinum]|nr:hypothetical protein [Salinigranum salinum]